MRCAQRLRSLGKQMWGLALTLHYVSFVLAVAPGALRFGEACVAAAAAEEQQQEPEGTSTDALLLCRACGHEVAVGADIRFVPSRLALSNRNDTLPGGRRFHVQLFENPHGHKFEVITFRKAAVTQHRPAEKRFSWFPGFAWTVATCPRCRTHLGWAFQPSVWPESVSQAKFEESDQTFLALIAQRLIREDFASSLLMTPKSFTS